ncbi:MAG: N-acetylneuraminate lyase [Planctomycetes bacterium]|nr:N-acetylneuraminate lyase [Planctomycetota bacterium]
MNPFRIRGLCAATHTPFAADGSLHLAAVEVQRDHLLARGVGQVFVGGSTGESHSLSLAERLALTERWTAAAKGTQLCVVVHVGSNCLTDAAELAAHAQRHGAAALGMLAPSYWKPRTVADLVACCELVARAAPALPFYFYDIPALTGVHLPMAEFLALAAPRIPNLNGIKFTNPDLMAYQLALRAGGGRFDLPWGCDEFFLAALALGAAGAVGSTFNFAPGVYQRLQAAFAAGDLATARAEQFRSVQLVEVLARRGYLGCAKALMVHLGVPVGPARLPNGNPDAAAVRAMFGELEQIGFFAWRDGAGPAVQ